MAGMLRCPYIFLTLLPGFLTRSMYAFVHRKPKNIIFCIYLFYHLQCKPLNGITLLQRQTNSNNRLIIISECSSVHFRYERVIYLGLAILDKLDPIFQFDPIIRDPIKLLYHLNKNCLFQDRGSSEGSRIDDAKDARRTSTRTGGSSRTTDARTITSPIKNIDSKTIRTISFFIGSLKTFILKCWHRVKIKSNFRENGTYRFCNLI